MVVGGWKTAGLIVLREEEEKMLLLGSFEPGGVALEKKLIVDDALAL